MSKLIFGVAGGMLMVCLLTDSQAAEAENAFVKVSADTPVYRLEQKGEKDFNAYCGGNTPAIFSVAAQQPDWELVTPANGSLEIKPGTSGVWQVKSQLREDKPEGKIYLWNYFIKAEEYNAKNITVPFGKTVTYSAYEGPTKVNSDWDVSGYENSKQKSNTDSIIFSRSFWNITEWFTESYSTPKPGVYEIKANLTGNHSVSDSGAMTVVGAEFTENESHNYGFDDYSNWSLGPTDYYKVGTERKGHCTLPYASVRAGDQGMAYLTVDPTSNTKDIQISSSASENDLALNPETAIATTDFTFTPALSWFPQTATVTAKMDDTPLAKMEVTSYDLRHYKCLLVPVSRDGITGSGVHSSCEKLNFVFKQAIIEFSRDIQKYVYNSFPPNDEWSDEDLLALATSFVQNNPNAKDDYDFFVFNIEGTYKVRPRSQGCANRNCYSFIFSLPIATGIIKYLAAHEIGHNFDLDDLYDTDTSEPGPDKDNLMNNSNLDCYKLRKYQWQTIRAHHND